MGRGIRPMQTFGADGLRASLELGEAMGLVSDEVRARYPEHYDAEGKLILREGKLPIFGIVQVDSDDGEISVVTEAKEANYYKSEFNV